MAEASAFANVVREWLGRIGVVTLYSEPGSPWEDGYPESFNGKLRAELLNAERFDTLLEIKVLVERYRMHYGPCPPTRLGLPTPPKFRQGAEHGPRDSPD